MPAWHLFKSACNLLAEREQAVARHWEMQASLPAFAPGLRNAMIYQFSLQLRGLRKVYFVLLFLSNEKNSYGHVTLRVPKGDLRGRGYVLETKQNP